MVDKIKSQYPLCTTIGYTSAVGKEGFLEGSFGEAYKEKMKQHFDELVFWDDNFLEKLKEIINKKQGEKKN